LTVVLDASAFLALLLDEPGRDYVDQALVNAAISTVNLCEVLSRIVRLGKQPGRVLDNVAATELAVIPFETLHAERAAELIRHVTSKGLSLGDRACLALVVLGAENAPFSPGEHADLGTARP